MNLWRWIRRTQVAKPEPEPPRYLPPSGPGTPRRCLYHIFAGRTVPCPRCGGRLDQQTHTYLLVTCYGARTSGVCYVANDMGWFCAACPTVVIDQERVVDALARAQAEGTEFAVLGFVDNDAIPSHQAHLPWSRIDLLPVVLFDPSLSPLVPPSDKPSRTRRLVRVLGQS